MNARTRGPSTLSFGQLLRELRLAAGLSQEELAERARMSSGGISVLERGARRAPHRETVTLLADALSLSGEARGFFESAALTTKKPRRRALPPIPITTVPNGNLPFALTSFVGRERSKTMLYERVLEQRLVTLTGVGGVGKTRLAIETGHELAGRFADGVWFVELAPVSDSNLIPHRVASTLNVNVAKDDGDSWIAELRDKRLLLVLDNCEHVIAPCASFVKTLLERCPYVHVLATTREALRISGERIVRVDPLREASTVEMFVERVRDAAPGFEADPEDENVRAICRSLDGIPLAVELAAARAPAMSLGEMAKNLDSRLALLRHGDRAAVPRQQTMRALIDWSYNLLLPSERRVFEELSVFAGGCTVREAAAVGLGDAGSNFEVLDLLTSLVEKSLVVVDMAVDESRYDLLEISREYAREKLNERGALQLTERHHAQAYFDLAQSLETHWEVTPSRKEYLHAVAELENWRAAIDWCLVRQNDVILGQRLVAALRRVWILFAPAEGRRMCRVAIESACADTPRAILANLEFTASQIAFHQFDHPSARAMAQEALDQYRRIGDRLGAAHAQRIIGVTLVLSGNLSVGEPILFEALAVAQEYHADRLSAHLEGAIAMARTIVNDLPGAIEHFSNARSISKAMGDEREVLTHSLNLAEALRKSGDIEGALRLSQETLESARALDHVFAVINALSGMAAYLVALDRFDEARALAIEALEASRKPRFGVFMLWILQHLAAAAALKARVTSVGDDAVYVRAARVLGYIDAHLPATQDTRDFTERVEYERALEALRSALSCGELDRLMLEGATMNEDEAIEQASLA